MIFLPSFQEKRKREYVNQKGCPAIIGTTINQIQVCCMKLSISDTIIHRYSFMVTRNILTAYETKARKSTDPCSFLLSALISRTR
jgi:hypothetical protein